VDSENDIKLGYFIGVLIQIIINSDGNCKSLSKRNLNRIINQILLNSTYK